MRSRCSSASTRSANALRAALMQALYGSGRQVEALEVYRETRRLLVDELGIEPSPALQELEQAILRHDPALTSQEAPAAPRQRAIMVVATDPDRLDDLLAIAEPLARRPARELILARSLARRMLSWRPRTPRSPSAETRSRSEGIASRIAAYTTGEPGADAVRLATEHDVDLVLARRSPGAPRERRSRPGSRGRPRARALRCRRARRERRDGHRADRDAVRRRRARLGRDRGGRLARPVARDDAPAPRNRGRIPLSGAAMPAGCLPAPRCSCSRWSESSPSRFSSARAKRVSSKRHATPACSSSAFPTAGEPKASATRGSPSRWAPRCRRSSCDAASGPAASPRTRR